MKKREHRKEECLPKHTLGLTVCNSCLLSICEKIQSRQFAESLLLTWCTLLTCPSMDRSSREERVVPSWPGMSTQTKCRFFGRN